MSVLAKTDSEASSLSHSSPPRSPLRSSERGPVYYVQSPSRDSHDGEKTTNSFQSSPMGSPPHSPLQLLPRPALARIRLHQVFGLAQHRAQKPIITMKSIRFDQFVVQAGEDFSGVATSMVSMNSTVTFTFRNTATFFGVHVKSTSLDLSIFELNVASGTTKKFYQSRKSQRPITVNLMGNKIPLYGPIQKGLLFHRPTPDYEEDLNKKQSLNLIQNLKSSFSLTLDIFYPLAGRLAVTENDADNTTSFSVDCNGAGAQFVHAAADGVTVAHILDPVFVPDDIVYSLF
ncbi:hypothetical protein M0R45_004500 [Rubus argutus]|uniref:Uncharacterized protein n=1 Tax=Rubus argutus TaxID=59490 RepID=A0AAW1YJY4_RUBAR